MTKDRQSANGQNAPVFQPGTRVAVRLPLPLTDAYDYRVPAGLTLAAGDFVRAPLGPRRMAGVVWGLGTGDVPDAKMKEILGRLDAPPMTAEAMAFVDWVSEYTLNPPGAVLRMALSVPAGDSSSGAMMSVTCGTRRLMKKEAGIVLAWALPIQSEVP